MQNGIEFFTATCLKWQPLLQPEEHKDIIMNSLKFLVEDKRILPKVGVAQGRCYHRPYTS